MALCFQSSVVNKACVCPVTQCLNIVSHVAAVWRKKGTWFTIFLSHAPFHCYFDIPFSEKCPYWLKFEAECIYLHVMTELTLTWQFFKPELYPGNQILIKVSFTSLFPIDADCVKTAITLEMPANPYNYACHIRMVARRNLFPINKPGRCRQLHNFFYIQLIISFGRYN